MKFIDWLDNFSNNAVSYIGNNSKWFYGISSIVIFIAIVIPVTISSGFNLLFILTMLLGACIIAWPLMLIYLLPFGLIQLLCYCIRHPWKAAFTVVKLIIGIILVYIFVFYLYAVLYGGNED